MTDRQKVELEMSNCRTKLRDLVSVDEPTDEQKTEMATLTNKMGDLEVRFRAAVAADEPVVETKVDAGEDREKRDLYGKASVSNWVNRILNRRNLDGAERELSEELNLQGDEVPFSLLADVREERAIITTPAAISATQDAIERDRTWLGRLFNASVVEALGITTRAIAPGQPMWTTLTDGIDPELVAKGTEISDSTTAFSTVTIDPVRRGATFLMAREDLMLYAGLEAEIRRDMSAALADQISDAVVNESTRFDGLIDALTFPAPGAAVADFGEVQDMAYESNDGLNSTSVNGVSWVMPVAAEKFLGKMYRVTAGTGATAEQNSDMTALAWLRANSGGITFSGHMPDIASKKFQAIGVRDRTVGPRAVLGVWEGVRIIEDDITGARKGERRVTAEAIIGFKVTRPASYVPYELRTEV